MGAKVFASRNQPATAETLMDLGVVIRGMRIYFERVPEQASWTDRSEWLPKASRSVFSSPNAPLRIRSVEPDIGDVLVVLSITRNEGKVMLESGGGDQQIKGTPSEFLALLSEGLPNMGTPSRDRR